MRQWQGSKRYDKYAKHSPSQSRDIRQQTERPDIQFPTPLSYPSRRNFDQNGIICFDAENKRHTLWCARRVRFSPCSHHLTPNIGVLPWNPQPTHLRWPKFDVRALSYNYKLCLLLFPGDRIYSCAYELGSLYIHLAVRKVLTISKMLP